MERSLTVAILMGTMNGAAYIREQLESIAGQTERDWTLYVSDDGSSDATCQIVERFAEVVPQFVTVRMGPRRGSWKIFLALPEIQQSRRTSSRSAIRMTCGMRTSYRER